MERGCLRLYTRTVESLESEVDTERGKLRGVGGIFRSFLFSFLRSPPRIKYLPSLPLTILRRLQTTEVVPTISACQAELSPALKTRLLPLSNLSRSHHHMEPPARRQRSRSYLDTAGAPACSIFDLPSSQALADLELVRSSSRSSLKATAGYAGGGGLGMTLSRGRVVGREGRIEEGAEGVDEEVALGKEGEVVRETEERARVMYERFGERRKGSIVAIVA